MQKCFLANKVIIVSPIDSFYKGLMLDNRTKEAAILSLETLSYQYNTDT